MVFTKRLRDGVRRGRITCTVRFWTAPKVKVGGRYRMDDGEIEIDSIERITMAEITPELARRSGFTSVADLLSVARHGPSNRGFLIRFRYSASFLPRQRTPSRAAAMRQKSTRKPA